MNTDPQSQTVGGRWTAAAMAASVLAGAISGTAGENSASWLDNTISPVANPIYFEDPRITSEVRPVFMQHYLPDTFHFSGGTAPLGGEVRVYAMQVRYALTERLGLIATKDGFIEMRAKNTLAHSHGWANIAAGLKYALVDAREQQFIVTPGFTVELPTGNTDVFQGRGAGEWNLFVSAEKGWSDLHLTGNLGFRMPNDFSKQTSQAHYSLQVDYRVCQYFIPFVVANGYTVLSEGDNRLLGAVDLNTELYDLINFGSTKAGGRTQVAVGGGLRSRLTPSLDLGVAYEAGVIDPVGIFDSRVTADLIWRF